MWDGFWSVFAVIYKSCSKAYENHKNIYINFLNLDGNKMKLYK